MIFPHGGIHHPAEAERALKNGAQLLAKASACTLLPLRISGIRGEGYTFLPLLIRSHARIEAFPRIPGNQAFSPDAQQQIENCLRRA